MIQYTMIMKRVHVVTASENDEYQAGQQGKDDPTEMYGSSPYFKYRKLVDSISQKLLKENALRLAYLYDLPNWYHEVGPTHDPTSALRILAALEGKGVFTPNNLAGLTEALEIIEREDLAKLVREFRKLINKQLRSYSFHIINIMSFFFFRYRRNSCSWEEQHSSTAGKSQ